MIDIRGEIVLNLENQRFKGNVLDIGVNNYGIVYNICNESKSNLEVDYLQNGKDKVKGRQYNSCVMFLGMSSLLFEKNKVKIFEMISRHLDENGKLFIWDIQKKRGEIIDVDIKVVLPYRKIKTINYRDYNIITKQGRNSLEVLLEKKFEIIVSRDINGLFYIEAQKKRRKLNEEKESNTSGNKL
ncbi:class I SAM-dependent methyltransferase [Clostridium sp. DL1XJH146]